MRYEISVVFHSIETRLSKLKKDLSDIGGHINAILPDGKMFKVTRPIKTFYTKGIVCKHCGLKAEYFLSKPSENIHSDKISLCLYGEKNGKLVMFTRDHIIPKSKGGSNGLVNNQTLCYDCNHNKRNNSEDVEIEKLYAIRHIKERVKEEGFNLVEEILRVKKENRGCLNENEMIQLLESLNSKSFRQYDINKFSSY